MATQATAFLRFSVDPNPDETVTIGAITYKFEQNTLDAPYEVKWVPNNQTCAENLVRAINGNGTVGVHYAAGTVAHEVVEASWIENEGDADITITVREPGAFGNHIHHADTFFDTGISAFTGGTGEAGGGAAAIQAELQNILASMQLSAGVQQALRELAFDPDTV